MSISGCLVYCRLPVGASEVKSMRFDCLMLSIVDVEVDAFRCAAQNETDAFRLLMLRSRRFLRLGFGHRQSSRQHTLPSREIMKGYSRALHWHQRNYSNTLSSDDSMCTVA